MVLSRASHLRSSRSRSMLLRIAATAKIKAAEIIHFHNLLCHRTNWSYISQNVTRLMFIAALRWSLQGLGVLFPGSYSGSRSSTLVPLRGSVAKKKLERMPAAPPSSDLIGRFFSNVFALRTSTVCIKPGARPMLSIRCVGYDQRNTRLL